MPFYNRLKECRVIHCEKPLFFKEGFFCKEHYPKEKVENAKVSYEYTEQEEPPTDPLTIEQEKKQTKIQKRREKDAQDRQNRRDSWEKRKDIH